MKFTVNSDSLVETFKVLLKIAPPRATIPILRDVLMEAEGNKLTLTCFDLEIAASTDLAAVVSEKGACTVQLRRLNNIIKSFAGTDIEFESDGGKLSFNVGTERYTLDASESAQFPDVPHPPEERVSLPAQTIKHLIDRTRFAVTKEQSRFTLAGLRRGAGDG